MIKPISQSHFGKTEPFFFQVAADLIPNHRSFQLFGYNSDIDTSEESVWPDGGVVPHPTVASALTIVSTSASDASAGTGARTVYIAGLDQKYNEVNETITLNGVTGVTTTKSYLYVNEFYVVTVGSSEANVGEITAKVSTTLYDLIAVGYNNRTTAHYCVPAGYTGYMTSGVITAGQASGSTSITAFLKQHSPDGVVRVGAVTTLNNGSVQYDFDPPYKIPEKNCVGASAIGSASNNSVSAFFNIVLVNNNV